MIHKCTCKHEFQDKHYGKGMRVFNILPTENNQVKIRCTVCKNEKYI